MKYLFLFQHFMQVLLISHGAAVWIQEFVYISVEHSAWHILSSQDTLLLLFLLRNQSIYNRKIS